MLNARENTIGLIQSGSRHAEQRAKIRTRFRRLQRRRLSVVFRCPQKSHEFLQFRRAGLESRGFNQSGVEIGDAAVSAPFLRPLSRSRARFLLRQQSAIDFAVRRSRQGVD